MRKRKLLIITVTALTLFGIGTNFVNTINQPSVVEAKRHKKRKRIKRTKRRFRRRIKRDSNYESFSHGKLISNYAKGNMAFTHFSLNEKEGYIKAYGKFTNRRKYPFSALNFYSDHFAGGANSSVFVMTPTQINNIDFKLPGHQINYQLLKSGILPARPMYNLPIILNRNDSELFHNKVKKIKKNRSINFLLVFRPNADDNPEINKITKEDKS